MPNSFSVQPTAPLWHLKRQAADLLAIKRLMRRKRISVRQFQAAVLCRSMARLERRPLTPGENAWLDQKEYEPNPEVDAIFLRVRECLSKYR